MTNRPESFFSAAATAASTSSRDTGGIAAGALVDTIEGRGSTPLPESGGCGRGVGTGGKLGDGGGAIER